MDDQAQTENSFEYVFMNGRNGALPIEYDFTLRDGKLELNNGEQGAGIDDDMISMLNYEDSDCENIRDGDPELKNEFETTDAEQGDSIDNEMISILNYEGSDCESIQDGEPEFNNEFEATDSEQAGGIDNEMISILNYEDSDCENTDSYVDMVSLVDYEGSSDTDNEHEHNHNEVFNLEFF